MAVSIGKSPINNVSSIAIIDYWRVSCLSPPGAFPKFLIDLFEQRLRILDEIFCRLLLSACGRPTHTTTGETVRCKIMSGECRCPPSLLVFLHCHRRLCKNFKNRCESSSAGSNLFFQQKSSHAKYTPICSQALHPNYRCQFG